MERRNHPSPVQESRATKVCENHRLATSSSASTERQEGKRENSRTIEGQRRDVARIVVSHPDVQCTSTLVCGRCLRLFPIHTGLPRHERPWAEDGGPSEVPEAARAKLHPRDEEHLGGADRSQPVPQPLRPHQGGEVARLRARVGMRKHVPSGFQKAMRASHSSGGVCGGCSKSVDLPPTPHKNRNRLEHQIQTYAQKMPVEPKATLSRSVCHVHTFLRHSGAQLRFDTQKRNTNTHEFDLLDKVPIITLMCRVISNSSRKRYAPALACEKRSIVQVFSPRWAFQRSQIIRSCWRLPLARLLHRMNTGLKLQASHVQGRDINL